MFWACKSAFYYTCRFAPDLLKLTDIFVAQSARGRSLGTTMLTQLFEVLPAPAHRPPLLVLARIFIKLREVIGDLKPRGFGTHKDMRLGSDLGIAFDCAKRNGSHDAIFCACQ